MAVTMLNGRDTRPFASAVAVRHGMFLCVLI